jgi:hypothetical protein
MASTTASNTATAIDAKIQARFFIAMSVWTASFPAIVSARPPALSPAARFHSYHIPPNYAYLLIQG